MSPTTEITVEDRKVAVPKYMQSLPVVRGFPVPWFVQWFKDGKATEYGDGEPDFRITDSRKVAAAVMRRLCWVCGGTLGRHLAFTVGPMCGVNRVSGEPPAHRDCAIFSALACPFLSRPHMTRRETVEDVNRKHPDVVEHPAHIRRNPGVMLVWITDSYTVIFPQDQACQTRQVLFQMGDPLDVMFFREGRTATVAEINESIDTGMPTLQEAAMYDGPEAVIALGTAHGIMKRVVERFALNG